MVQTGAVALARINKIFNKPPASTFTVTSITITAGTLGGWGGASESVTSTTTVAGVPYSVITKDRIYNPQGLDNQGNLRIAMPGSTTISTDDLITGDLLSGTYEVTNVQDYPYHEVNLAKVITAVQKTSNS